MQNFPRKQYIVYAKGWGLKGARGGTQRAGVKGARHSKGRGQRGAALKGAGAKGPGLKGVGLKRRTAPKALCVT